MFQKRRNPFKAISTSSLACLAILTALAAPAGAQVVIHEILQNPSAVGDSAGEWLELFNPTASAIDIEGWTLQDNDIDSHVIANGGPLLIPAGGFLVLGNNADGATNGGVAVDYEFSGMFLANGADELVLLDGALVEIDRVEWDGGAAFPDPNGASMALAAPALDNNVGANWCTAQTIFGAGDRGTPGAANDCPPPEVVIHEILQNPSAVSDSAGEWLELFNPGASPVDIEGWTIQDNDFDSHVISSGGPLLVPAGGFLVLGNNADSVTNGGVTVDYEFSGVFLGNSADELVLSDGALVEVDRVEWDGGTAFPDPTGASMALADPALDNNDGANWCEAQTPFGDGDLGTPGAANDCPIAEVPPIVIHELIQNPSAVGDSAGEWLELFNPTASAVDIEGWTLRDNDFDSHVISSGGPLLIPAGGFLVLGNNADSATNGGVAVDYEFSGIFLSNSADELVLLDTAAAEVDRVEWDNGATFPDPNGASMALADPTLDNNVGANWCTASTPFGDGDLGTPGAANDCPVAQLVINEVDYDQPSSDTAEFIELTNVGGAPADLSAFTLELVNGNGGSVYRTLALPAASLAPGDTFVVCGNAFLVANCDLDVTPDSNLVQNGSPDAIRLLRGATVVDALSYEGDVAGAVEGSGAGLEDDSSGGVGGVNQYKGLSRFPDGTDTDQNNLDFTFSCITPGQPNSDRTTGCSPLGPIVEIFEIQGAGLASPFDGQVVRTTDNVVTAVGTNGFFLQTPPERSDGDPATSDGVFVFTGGAPTVAAGDRVDVAGSVVEFFDLTEITGNPTVSVLSSGNPLPAAVSFSAALPAPAPSPQSAQLEPFEGMLVIFDGLASGPSDGFGDVGVVTQASRSFREPGIEFPGQPGLPVWDGNPEVFEIDPDGLGGPGVDVFATQAVAAEGPLTFRFGDYQVLPKALVLGPQPDVLRAVRARQPGELTVASQNMLRLFAGDPAGVLEVFSEHIRVNLGAPDILAMQEVENLAVLTALAARIQADDPALAYSAHLIEGNDVGGIDVGYLTRDDTVQVLSVDPFGEDLLLSVDSSLLHDRPPLVLEALYVGDGASFPITLVDVHNRSLGGIEDPDDGARVKTKRLEQAESIAGLVQDLQTADPDIHLVVLGDFNAFQFTDGFVDVVGVISGDLDPAGAELPGADLVEPNLTNQVSSLPAAERYSFVFGGNAQALDHILTSSSLTDLVRGVEFARGNADSPAGLHDVLTTTLRASDHDGLVLYLFADSDGDGVADGDDACPGTVIPESVPTNGLGTNRYALVDGDNVFDTASPPGGGPGDVFTTQDTAGCSCEQIIAAEGLGNGHVKHGCSVGVMRNWADSVSP